MVGILPDDSDPMVSVMKVDKAPLESYADIGGLESQVRAVFLLLWFIFSASTDFSFACHDSVVHRFRRLRRPLSCR